MMWFVLIIVGIFVAMVNLVAGALWLVLETTLWLAERLQRWLDKRV